MKFNIIKTIPLVLTALLVSCTSDTEEAKAVHDPSKPVEITGFEPKEGGLRTRLYIQGKNFGSNPEDIKVKIGGVSTKVIGSNGEIIYCMVPFKASEGSIEVTVGENGTPVIANEKFKYIPNTVVGTVAGKVDETGKVEVKDGTFEEAGFVGPNWLKVDPKDPNTVYVIDGGGWKGVSVRKLDLKNRTVTTHLTLGEGTWANLRCLEFTLGGDTMLIANENNATGSIGLSYLTRENGFKKPQAILSERRVTCVAQHPNGELYYNSRVTGELFRYDWEKNEITKVTTIIGANTVYFIFIHPTGKYAYITVGGNGIIMKAKYNDELKTFDVPDVFCGLNKPNSSSKGEWVDGQGTNARLGSPGQGVFVKNPDYAGREDEYDFYFADSKNHCIRILTPDAQVTTYAGRGSQGVNDDPNGYVDGDLRQEARFNYPFGLYLDQVNEIFYIGDADNFRVRNIVRDE